MRMALASLRDKSLVHAIGQHRLDTGAGVFHRNLWRAGAALINNSDMITGRIRAGHKRTLRGLNTDMGRRHAGGFVPGILVR